jgi:hypothetical protein
MTVKEFIGGIYKKPMSLKKESRAEHADESFSVNVDPAKEEVSFLYRAHFRRWSDLKPFKKIKEFFHG